MGVEFDKMARTSSTIGSWTTNECVLKMSKPCCELTYPSHVQYSLLMCGAWSCVAPCPPFFSKLQTNSSFFQPQRLSGCSCRVPRAAGSCGKFTCPFSIVAFPCQIDGRQPMSTNCFSPLTGRILPNVCHVLCHMHSGLTSNVGIQMVCFVDNNSSLQNSVTVLRLAALLLHMLWEGWLETRFSQAENMKMNI